MAQYDNTDTGVLFKNDKRGNEKAPDYTGDIYDARGNKRRLAAWIKQSKGGTPFMSLKITDHRERQEAPREPEAPAPQQGGFDDIPF